jgi:hypothetical protein
MNGRTFVRPLGEMPLSIPRILKAMPSQTRPASSRHYDGFFSAFAFFFFFFIAMVVFLWVSVKPPAGGSLSSGPAPYRE